MSPWMLNVYIDEVMKEVTMRMGKGEERFLEDERE